MSNYYIFFIVCGAILVPLLEKICMINVKTEDENVKASRYHVNNYKWPIINLARTTVRNIIGTLRLISAVSEHNKINISPLSILGIKTKHGGSDVVRTERKEINPPKDVQETMNKVVKAENEKIAAIDFIAASETATDSQKRTEVKKAEGEASAIQFHIEKPVDPGDQVAEVCFVLSFARKSAG